MVPPVPPLPAPCRLPQTDRAQSLGRQQLGGLSAHWSRHQTNLKRRHGPCHLAAFADMSNFIASSALRHLVGAPTRPSQLCSKGKPSLSHPKQCQHARPITFGTKSAPQSLKPQMVPKAQKRMVLSVVPNTKNIGMVRLQNLKD